VLWVDHYEVIRRTVNVEGLSQREAARRLGHSRKTVRKALDHSTPPGYRRTSEIARPAIDPVKHIINAWLEEDTKRPRKQRHTGERIWQRLRDEHGFEGSASAVRRYLADLHETQGEVFFPLCFDPGEEAQVDWGEGWYIENGLELKVFLFCMRMCHSGASFVYPYERMTQEALLDGHVRAFEFFGKVPRTLAYDNLKAVVISIGKGQDRELTSRFKDLRSHYLFEARFCNAASGNEKGHVENLVKWAQHNILTPLPVVTGLEQLAEHCLSECRKDLTRPTTRSDQARGEVLEVERPSMLPLPARAFDAYKPDESKASQQSLVRFDRNDYSVPVAYAHHACAIKGYVDRVEICVRDQTVAVHERCYEKQKYVLEYQHYIPLLETKPGGIHHARPFKGEPWGEDFARMRRELEYRYGSAGTKQFVKVLLLFTNYPEQSVKAAVVECVRRCAFSEGAVRSALAYLPVRSINPINLAHCPELAAIECPARPASVYQALCGEAVMA
jgi:transposase